MYVEIITMLPSAILRFDRLLRELQDEFCYVKFVANYRVGKIEEGMSRLYVGRHLIVILEQEIN